MSNVYIVLSLVGCLVLLSIVRTSLQRRTETFLDHRSIPHDPSWTPHPAYGTERNGAEECVPSSTPDGVEMYRLEWRAVRARFRRSPGLAIAQADDLLKRLQEGAAYSVPSRSRADVRDLGIVLDWARRRDLKRVFAYYRSILDEALFRSAGDQITLDRVRPERIDLRVSSTAGLRRPADRSR